jgi:PAS domain S-box-containing protein
MSLSLLLISGPPYLEAPQGILGWIGLLLLAAFEAYLLKRWWNLRRKKWGAAQWMVLAVLLVLVPLTSLFVVLRLPVGSALPPPGKPIEPVGPALALFAAVPWVLAAGLLGTIPSFSMALLSGLILALWDTHNPFTILELTLAALLLSAFLHQRYRTVMFKFLRQPFASLALLVFVYPLLFLFNTSLMVTGSLTSRLDYAFSRTWNAWVSLGVSFLLAGLIAAVVALILSELWGTRGPWVAAPSERKLETRFYFTMGPLALVLLAALMAGDWVLSWTAARQMLRDRMASTASTASETLPYLLESGQSLIKQFADDPQLYQLTGNRLSDVLSQNLRSVPYFRQLYLLDVEGKSITGYPYNNYENSFPPAEERVGVKLALQGVPVLDYSIPEMDGDKAAQVTFIAAVTDDTGSVRGVLVGRTALESNPFTKSVLANIENMVGTDGEGMLLDGDGRILYHHNAAHLMEIYTGQIYNEVMFYEDAAPDGTRRLVYYQPVLGHPWSIVLSVPARRAQQLALNIAVPLLGMVLVLFAVSALVLRYGVKFITRSLHSLGVEVQRISSGELDHPLNSNGEDEIGQLGRAFEGMRISLRSRLEELNRLLAVSQGVASSLDVHEAAQPVLEAALSVGASSARIVLADAALTEGDQSQPVRFGLGPASDAYTTLDDQILIHTRKQDRLPLNNLTRIRLLTIPSGHPRPEALLAVALRHENQYYGALWLAYEHSHHFGEDELRFVSTLAGQAALAAANSKLFQSAEIGRQRLAAILASNPDPVLVTDHKNHLLLSNPAAWQVLGFGAETGAGMPIERVTSNKELTKLLRQGADDRQSAEVTLLNGKIYLATASSVISDGQRMGRVCVLRDITYFKELDQAKSEFVSTVSHDLRSPLTLMRGYATMLEMVGELNEQQSGYIRKIVGAVEGMSHLVNNLLDLGRIEAGVDLQLEMVLVHDVVERVISNEQPSASMKRITLAADVPSETVPLIEADKELLLQALQNLVGNALKYTESGGKVTVSVQTRPDGMVFSVSDTGIGIAPVDIPRLFDKFFRVASREAKKQHGTGLGLAIVKSIAEKHGGKVWVESQLGKGSCFYFQIPLRQAKE